MSMSALCFTCGVNRVVVFGFIIFVLNVVFGVVLVVDGYIRFVLFFSELECSVLVV